MSAWTPIVIFFCLVIVLAGVMMGIGVSWYYAPPVFVAAGAFLHQRGDL